MKKRYMVLELLAIFVILILPPLMTSKGDGISRASEFSPYILIQLVIAMILYWQHLRLNPPAEKKKTAALIKNLFWFSICLGILMLIFAFTQALSLLLHLESPNQTVPQGLVVKHAHNWIFVVLTISTGAFYEEILYRLFFTDFLHSIFNKKNKVSFYSIEMLSLLIFAFSHRYLGMVSVINAFLCGIMLRLCLVKSRSPFPGFAAHFTYNFSLVLFSVLMA